MLAVSRRSSRSSTRPCCPATCNLFPPTACESSGSESRQTRMQSATWAPGVQERVERDQDAQSIWKALLQVDRPFCVVDRCGELAVSYDESMPERDAPGLKAFVPALRPQDLGDPAF